ncbi:MAG: beta-propeller fold lactonase family protein [Acidobacteriota bacterium]|nr:beta-propeller fold lactonase family protein [Acidobacteriota bacterium]
MRVSVVRGGAVAVLAGLLALCGCTGFFVPVTTTNGGGNTSSSANWAYVANTATRTVSGFAVGTGTLTSAGNMPQDVTYAPQALAMANGYLYVAVPGAIYPYAIASDGSLTAVAGAVLVNAVAMDVSPDGNWIAALDAINTQVDILSLNSSTGAAALAGTVAYGASGTALSPKAVKFAPNGALVFAALGAGGDAIFTFNTATGATVLSGTLAAPNAQTSDNALAVDSTSTHLYVARSGTSGGLAVYSIGNAGALTALAGSPFAAGTQPLAVLLDSTGSYAYVANGSDGTISGYALASGKPTALASSPFASGVEVRSLALDATGKYLLAVAQGGAPDLTLYSFDATSGGKLDPVATAASGTDPAGSIAVVSGN